MSRTEWKIPADRDSNVGAGWRRADRRKTAYVLLETLAQRTKFVGSKGSEALLVSRGQIVDQTRNAACNGADGGASPALCSATNGSTGAGAAGDNQHLALPGTVPARRRDFPLDYALGRDPLSHRPPTGGVVAKAFASWGLTKPGPKLTGGLKSSANGETSGWL